MNHTSSEFELLATAANFIREDIEKSKENWNNSPFSWIITLPPGTKGKLGTLLIRQWLILKELSIGKSPDSEADLLINGHRVEVKFSTLWDEGIYKFQQIRDQNYEYIICLGISPQNAHCWVIDKDTLHKKVIGHMGQHTGKSAKDTAWLSVNPETPHEWLAQFGGSLSDAFEIIRKIKPI